MIDPTTALTTAIENSTKVANTPLFSTVIDRCLGYKISEWNAQGNVIKKQICDGYEEAKQKGLGIQYVSAFRSSTNLINIGRKAVRYIDSTKKTEVEIENDVFWGLINHSKEISNEEMQELIAKIIAGEYNAPGTYSMSTLQTIKMLGKNEIELFENICGLIINDDQVPAEIFSSIIALKEFHIDFGKLQTLQSLGLFFPNDMSSSGDDDVESVDITYFDKIITFKTTDNIKHKVTLPGHYGLTPVGKQIIKHINPKYNNDYENWLKNNYKISNFRVVLSV